jgi:hypothetical protein
MNGGNSFFDTSVNTVRAACRTDALIAEDRDRAVQIIERYKLGDSLSVTPDCYTNEF